MLNELNVKKHSPIIKPREGGYNDCFIDRV